MNHTSFITAGTAALLVLASCASRGQPASFSLIESGKTARAQALFSGKESFDERDERGRTALHVAAENGNVEMARFLLALGASADAEDSQGRTALGIAASRLDAQAAYPLVQAGADIHHPFYNGSSDTPAKTGARQGGPFLESLLTPKTVNAADSDGITVLHLAAMEGNPQAVTEILAAGAQVNGRDKSGKTALDYALENTETVIHVETAEKIILGGGSSANPFYEYLSPAVRSSNYNIRLKDGYTVYHYAAREGYRGYIQFLAGKNADVNIKNNAGSSPLHEAFRMGRLEAASMLIAGGADVNAQDAKGNSALHLAIPPEQHHDAIALLLAAGANPNLRDVHGETALNVAITLNRSPEIITSLLEGGSDVTNRNIEGKTALYLAVEDNRVDIVPLLIAAHSGILAADNTGLTPFEKAIQENSPCLPALLTEESVTQKDSAGNSPLHIAVRNKADVGVTNTILDLHAPVDSRNKEGNTALHIANMVNNEPSGTLLISRGADIFAANSKGESPLYLAFHSPGNVREWMLTPTTLEARDGLGNTALHYAAQWKLAAHVPLLVRRGSKLEARNATGETPLFMAARVNSGETIRALIASGALVDARDSLGNSALHAAVRWNAPDAVETLTASGLSVNAQNLSGKTPLHDAVRLGITSVENQLIRKGANLEARDIDGNTPLMEAVMGGFPAAAERLAEAGADPVSRNNNGDTPLHIAVSLQRQDMVTLLLNFGAPIHARNSRSTTPFETALVTSVTMVTTLLTKDRVLMADDDGLSPLHIAIKKHASPALVKTIISRGARISSVDGEGRTPLRLALDLNALEEAKVLSDAGSDVFSPASDGKTPAAVALAKGDGALRAVFSGKAINSRDGTGNTVLHYAAQSGRAEMIAVLLELGANKNIRNIASESPADIALRWNYREAAALLN
jgi:ankyrin repeat protein